MQDFGGQAERSAIKEKLVSSNDDIAKFANKEYISKKTGNEYKKFNFRFNFALKNLMLSDFLTYIRGNSMVTLTDKGMNVDVHTLNLEDEVYALSSKYWDEKRAENKKKKISPTKAIQDNDSTKNDAVSFENYSTDRN